MFLDEERLPFLPRLRSARADIRAECRALGDESFEPRVQRQMYGTEWSVYGLVAFGSRIEAALAACPRTAAFPALRLLRPGRTMAELDPVPAEVAAVVERASSAG